jgi:hypothetical protein
MQMSPDLGIFEAVYNFFSAIEPGEWLVFAAEVAVALVIYFELEHNRRTTFLEKATGKSSDQERRDIYAAFLGCKMGDSDLEYDPRTQFLQWKDDTGHRVGVQFAIPHRIRVSIKSPAAGSRAASLLACASCF